MFMSEGNNQEEAGCFPTPTATHRSAFEEPRESLSLGVGHECCLPASFDRRYACSIDEYDRLSKILQTPGTRLNQLQDNLRITYCDQSGDLLVRGMASRLQDAVSEFVNSRIRDAIRDDRGFLTEDEFEELRFPPHSTGILLPPNVRDRVTRRDMEARRRVTFVCPAFYDPAEAVFRRYLHNHNHHAVREAAKRSG